MNCVEVCCDLTSYDEARYLGEVPRPAGRALGALGYKRPSNKKCAIASCRFSPPGQRSSSSRRGMIVSDGGSGGDDGDGDGDGDGAVAASEEVSAALVGCANLNAGAKLSKIHSLTRSPPQTATALSELSCPLRSRQTTFTLSWTRPCRCAAPHDDHRTLPVWPPRAPRTARSPYPSLPPPGAPPRQTKPTQPALQAPHAPAQPVSARV